MHAQSDSEVTSFDASSPSRWPRQPTYYVQNPSGSSHDGEKTSMNSTPLFSPTDSPSQSVLAGRRSSGASRVSYSLRTTSSRTDKGEKLWRRSIFAAVEEEGLLEDEDHDKGISRRCYVLLFLLTFSLLFSLFSLILWGTARPQKPTIAVKNISFQSFYLHAGSDSSGVQTIMLSTNSTIKLVYRNTATFFGVHVSSSPLSLYYSRLNVATGYINNFYLERKSQRTLTVPLQGKSVPLYGASYGLTTAWQLYVPLNLSFIVRSRAFVLGKLVKPMFCDDVQCSVVMDRTKLGNSVSLLNSCQFE